MTKIHDMGGVACSEALPSENDKIFEKEWHKKILSLTLAAGALGKWNIDRSRYFREALPTEDYQKFSYYEKWMAALVNLLVDSCLVSRSELEQFECIESSEHENCASSQSIRKMISVGDSSVCVANSSFQPFEVGQLVKTKHPPGNRFLEEGHTRLPAYSSGYTGKIITYHGFHRFPDSHAHFLGANPEPLYTVRFKAKTLWGSDTEFPNDEINLDLWHSYLDLFSTR